MNPIIQTCRVSRQTHNRVQGEGAAAPECRQTFLAVEQRRSPIHDTLDPSDELALITLHDKSMKAITTDALETMRKGIYPDR